MNFWWRLSEWLRRTARRPAAAVLAWSERRVWLTPRPGQVLPGSGPVLFRRAPRRFVDLDKFDAFIDVMFPPVGGLAPRLLHPAHTHGDTAKGVKRAVAEASVGSRHLLSSINLQAVDVTTGEVAWTLAASNALNRNVDLPAVTVVTSGSAETHWTGVTTMFDLHTERMTRSERRAKVALVSSQREPDARQAEHDVKIATRAAQIGGLWGVAGGLASGIGGALIVRAVGG